MSTEAEVRSSSGEEESGKRQDWKQLQVFGTARYARVSTKDQTIELQVDALTQAECTKVYTAIISGAR